MKKVSELVKFLKDPHAKKVQNYKERYQELDDLSHVAAEIGDAAAYKSLEAEMREVFFDYLTAVVVDSIYRLVPHVLIIWIISLKWPYITVPFVDWQVSILGVYLSAYLLFHAGKWLEKPIKSKLLKLGLVNFARASEVTK
ncbi:hypothetical protein Desor_0103 [Desulfosporosinus orientis DSM 765]|uniref:Holin of 3TMs, for gene-transfer release n=1 Tax=Desulfosporosinus orientis (strain ATCC 19365 / DSM 765 / NCIMB 8382 / VKM B-1628 / Singapore I) TaxID=768706 RepID=G7W4Y4_DESOD|nr:hypothetical protein [Desulfosporosinus orientis]AET65856.1 hypothetical protein Desor_0103 [Desulfosporosinus orientis DSM 765]